MNSDLLLIGVEDTDTATSELGTGKITRRLGPELPDGAEMVGVVRHQLLLSPEIPYTSWNSPACAIVRLANPDLEHAVAEVAHRHVARLAADGSNPAICVARVGRVGADVVAFGVDCRRRVLTMDDARRVSTGLILESLGGSGGGIIGALGAVGLTAHGWCGRFIEVTALEGRPLTNSVAELAACGVRLVVMDRDAPPPLDEDTVTVPDQFRPQLVGGLPALRIHAAGRGRWRTESWPKRRES